MAKRRLPLPEIRIFARLMFKPALKKLLLRLFPASYKKRLFRTLEIFSWKTITGIWLDPELLLLEELLKNKNDVFFDIGANKGEFCFAAEKLVGAANIYAFEPNPGLHAVLKRVFPEIHLQALALSDTTGTASFKVPAIHNKTDDTLGTLETSYRENNETAGQTFPVQTITLDSFVEQHQINKINLIKIDVEGHEIKVMTGARNTIEQFKPDLIVEIEQRHHTNESLPGLLKPYFDMGYSACYFSFSQLKLIELTNPPQAVQNLSAHGTRDYVNNFIFIHNKARFSSFIHEVNQKAGKA